jgi:adenylate kinase
VVLRLVIFGAPGAGKGTQAALLSKKFSAIHLSTGDLLREAIRKKTAVGLEARVFMDRGDLVPDEIVLRIVKEKFDTDVGERAFLLDGFPRTLMQAQVLDVFLRDSNRSLSGVVSLEVSEEKLLKRLAGRLTCPLCQSSYHIGQFAAGEEARCKKDGELLVHREDDQEAAVRARLRAFEKQTLPLRAYYESRGLLKRVSGEGSPSDVFERILEALGEVG